MCLWNYISRSWCERAWLKWYGWVIRTRLEPIKAVAPDFDSSQRKYLIWQ